MSWHLAKSFVGPALAHPEDDYFARVLPVCLRSWDGSSGRPMDRITARQPGKGLPCATAGHGVPQKASPFAPGGVNGSRILTPYRQLNLDPLPPGLITQRRR